MVKSKFAAARHELHCVECRVTWTSWIKRLLGIKSGYTPGKSRRPSSDTGDGA